MGERTADVRPGDIAGTLRRLARTIHERYGHHPQQSYTARLLKGELDDLLKKLGEESTELILAVKDNDHDHIRYEAADLLYHLLVVLERSEVSLAELAGELDARVK